MAYLVPTKIIKEGGVVINQKLTPDGYALKPNRKMVIKGITVHNTGTISTNSATNPAEQYARATYPNGNMKSVAVHYWVYKDVIWQQLRDDEQGWHAGSTTRKSKRGEIIGGNQNNISIECISDSKESEETTKKLVALLCKRHGLKPLLDVYTHNFWMYGVEKMLQGVRKNCPIYILNHWAEFLNSTQALMGGSTAPVADKGFYVLNDKGAGVKALQTDLVELGYKLSVDGSFGNGMDAVVRQFQKDNKLTIDGSAGTGTLAKIAELLKIKRTPPVVKPVVKPVVPPVTPQAPVEDDKMYRVQVGYFGKEANAEATMKLLKDKGFDAIIKEEDKK